MIAREIYTESIINALKVAKKKSRIRRDRGENAAKNGIRRDRGENAAKKRNKAGQRRECSKKWNKAVRK